MCEKERETGQNNVEDMKNMEMKDQAVQSMTLHLMENRKAYGYTTWGCMWEKGAVSKDASFNVYAKDSTNNKMVPSSFTGITSNVSPFLLSAV